MIGMGVILLMIFFVLNFVLKVVYLFFCIIKDNLVLRYYFIFVVRRIMRLKLWI